jgi:hypothetical protein
MKPTTLQARIDRLMPAGVPRYVRCYAGPDDGSFDRFTVVFTGRAAVERGSLCCPNHYPYVGLSGHGSTPNKPCDVDRWGFAPAMGRSNHLGKRVPFSEMPHGLQQTALRDYREIWRLT